MYQGNQTLSAQSQQELMILNGDALCVTWKLAHNVIVGATACCWRIIVIIKRGGSARLRESDIHPISPKSPAPQYQPIDRNKRKNSRIDYSRDRAA